MNYTFNEYQEQVLKTKLENPSWRLGQTYFNVLHEVRPDLAELVRATGLDPFYRDGIIPSFLDFVEAAW